MISQLLIMVMEGRHFEYASSLAVFSFCILEVRHLQYHTKNFHQENTTEYGDEEFLTKQYRHTGNDRTQCKTSGIPHKNRRRIGIVPQKSDACSHETSCKNYELTC